VTETWQSWTDVGNNLIQVVVHLWAAFVILLGLLLHWSVLVAWLAWSLFSIDWNKVWPVLTRGAWAVVVLAGLTIALVWSQLAPSTDVLPNFWWQLTAVAIIIGLTLFCGWLQGVMNWRPAEVILEPPPDQHEAHGQAHAAH
jgi:hypothetical protein